MRRPPHTLSASLHRRAVATCANQPPQRHQGCNLHEVYGFMGLHGLQNCLFQSYKLNGFDTVVLTEECSWIEAGPEAERRKHLHIKTCDSTWLALCLCLCLRASGRGAILLTTVLGKCALSKVTEHETETGILHDSHRALSHLRAWLQPAGRGHMPQL